MITVISASFALLFLLCFAHGFNHNLQLILSQQQINQSMKKIENQVIKEQIVNKKFDDINLGGQLSIETTLTDIKINSFYSDPDKRTLQMNDTDNHIIRQIPINVMEIEYVQVIQNQFLATKQKYYLQLHESILVIKLGFQMNSDHLLEMKVIEIQLFLGPVYFLDQYHNVFTQQGMAQAALRLTQYLVNNYIGIIQQQLQDAIKDLFYTFKLSTDLLQVDYSYTQTPKVQDGCLHLYIKITFPQISFMFEDQDNEKNNKNFLFFPSPDSNLSQLLVHESLVKQLIYSVMLKKDLLVFNYTTSAALSPTTSYTTETCSAFFPNMYSYNPPQGLIFEISITKIYKLLKLSLSMDKAKLEAPVSVRIFVNDLQNNQQIPYLLHSINATIEAEFSLFFSNLMFTLNNEALEINNIVYSQQDIQNQNLNIDEVYDAMPVMLRQTQSTMNQQLFLHPFNFSEINPYIQANKIEGTQINGRSILIKWL